MQRSQHGRHAALPEPLPAAPVRSRAALEPPPRGRGSTAWLVLAAVGVVSAALVIALVNHGSGIEKVKYSSNAGPETLFGASASSTGQLADDTSQFGHMPIVRTFYPGLPSSNAWTTGPAAANKSAAIVSFKALPGDVLSGADDANLSHFFDSAPRGDSIYYSYYPEPERRIDAGMFTLAGYKAAWAHIVALANAANNPDLHSTLILTSYDVSAQSGRNWKDYLPGGGVISTLGWDAYPVGSVEDNNPQLTPPAAFMGPEVAASKSVGLPFGFAEFALARQDGRPGWLTQVGNYIASSGAIFGTLFNSPSWPTMKLTDSGSIAAWRSIVATSGSGVPPAPSPSPAPTSPPPASPSPSPPPPSTPGGLSVDGLSITPGTFAESGQNHATISFSLSQAANVTVCILKSDGTVVRLLARPQRAAGRVNVGYYGYEMNGVRDLNGVYSVLVVASNSTGSASAEGTLSITPG